MSDCVRPHRQQPTRLPCPWDSPGKNTGVGCHFLLQCMKVKRENEVAQSCLTLSYAMDCSLPGSSIHGIFQARVLEWDAIAFSDCYCNVKENIWIPKNSAPKRYLWQWVMCILSLVSILQNERLWPLFYIHKILQVVASLELTPQVSPFKAMSENKIK